MHSIFISVGTNIDRHKHTLAGVLGIKQHFENVRVSKVYESESVGFVGSNFYNLVAQAQTSYSVEEVCKVLKELEQDNGRVRSDKKFAARTLDLDLLLYDDIVSDAEVELPRAEILYNAFVLLPLAELVPDMVHPLAKQSYATLWQEYDQTQQSLWPVEFTWSESEQ